MLKSMIMTTCRLSFVVAMVCGAIVSLPVDAQEDAKPAKKPAQGVAQPFNLPDSIKLTDDQTKKLEELKKEATPKLEAAVKKVDDVLTKDQKKTRKTASDTAKAAGKREGTEGCRHRSSQAFRRAEGIVGQGRERTG